MTTGYRSTYQKLAHRALVEEILGRSLSPKHPIHHVNENTMDNRRSNLVVCEDNAYHHLLHERTKVVHAGGKPGLQRFCSHCKQLKTRTEFPRGRQTGYFRGPCRECSRARQQANFKRFGGGYKKGTVKVFGALARLAAPFALMMGIRGDDLPVTVRCANCNQMLVMDVKRSSSWRGGTRLFACSLRCRGIMNGIRGGRRRVVFA